MKKIILILMAFAFVHVANAQQKNHWSKHNATDKVTTHKSVARASFPKTFNAFDLNIPAFEQELMSIVGKGKTSNKVKVSFPNADGNIEEFELVEASNFEPALQERFPEIRAYSGRGITDPYATIKVSLSPDGVQTMTFRADKENEFIEKYSDDKKTYAVFRSQRKPGALPWDCATKQDQLMVSSINDQLLSTNIVARSGADLKTMRLAQSCNGEYSNYFGATSSAQVALVLAAYNNTLTRCNGVYEKDLALHLNLIANTEAVIYYNASTDPYTTMGSWNGQLQTALDAVIGAANYDIGHMFGASGGGGNAGCIGCVCDAKKGSGITSPADGIPQGDNFDIDYVIHEVGHQLGANHTFSMSSEGTGVNKEVGSGITIMGYAGITAQDVAPHSIDIFHQASIAQIQSNLAGKACPITTNIAANNSTPVVATVPNYTIPKSTPFALTGSATDTNGDQLTFCWEQNDNSTTTGNLSVASETKTTGPNWISFIPTTSPTRYFPRLSNILAGSLITGTLGGDAVANVEALSSVARTLNFRLTVRDNVPYSSTAPIKVGQTQFTDMVVTVNGTAGPFAVSAPNTAVSWPAGSTQTITWSVNSTNLSPINCANVKISLSTDGGQTFPTVLAASTPNDGTEALVIPASQSTTARIKIEAVGNIFFDISNANFNITAPALCGDPTTLTSTAISNNGATINWVAVSGANSYAVDYKTAASATWTSLSLAQATTTATLSGLSAATTYNWRVSATCPAGTGSLVSANFTTLPNCGNPTGLTNSSIANTGATLSWTGGAYNSSFTVSYRPAGSTAWTTFTPVATSIILSTLTPGTYYDWQIQAACATTSANSSIVAGTRFYTTNSTCVSSYDNSSINNNITTSAAIIPFNANITGQINIANDNDLYSFTITNGGSITLSLSTLPANYNLQLLNSSGTALNTSQKTGTTSESITATVAANTTYYARVYPSSSTIFNATNCYTLKVTLGTATKISDVIVGSANNQLAATSELNNSNESVTVYPNPVEQMLNINLNGLTGNSEINLYNLNGVRIMSKKTNQSAIQFDLSKLSSGVYMIKVLNGNKTVSRHKIVKR